MGIMLPGRVPVLGSWRQVRCKCAGEGSQHHVLAQDPSTGCAPLGAGCGYWVHGAAAGSQPGFSCSTPVRLHGTGAYWELGAGCWELVTSCLYQLRTQDPPLSTFQEQNPTPGAPLPAALSIPACPRGCVLTRGSAGAAIALGSQSQGPGNACAVPRLGSAPLRSRCLSLSPRCRARRRRQRSGGGGRGQRGSGGSERRCWAVAARMPGP